MIPASFFDELDKIAQDTGPSMAEARSMGPDRYPNLPSELPEQDRFITKDKLKRALIVAGLSAAGGAIGHGGASLIRNQVMHLDPNSMSKLMKYTPAITGALALPLGWLAKEQARKADRYIAYGNEKKPPNA